LLNEMQPLVAAGAVQQRPVISCGGTAELSGA
jgi:hypothetical protein